jgi:hypothetical protein
MFENRSVAFITVRYIIGRTAASLRRYIANLGESKNGHEFSEADFPVDQTRPSSDDLAYMIIKSDELRRCTEV